MAWWRRNPPSPDPAVVADLPLIRPFHAAAAAFLDSGFDGRFAALVKGRGGWHRTILYVYSGKGQLVYKEVLDDDYQSIAPYPVAGGAVAFVIGGRGEVWSYEFN